MKLYKCDGCKFQSDKIAKLDNESGLVLALCLNLKSNQHGKYSGGYGKCEFKEIGEPIDLYY